MTHRAEDMEGLVRAYLEREAERVDVDVLLEQVRARRRRRRIWRLWPVAAAAAALLVVAVGVGIRSQSAPDRPQTAQVTLALRQSEAALLSHLRAALAGAMSAGSAAVEVGTGPLKEIADARVVVPDLSTRTLKLLPGLAVWSDGLAGPDAVNGEEITE